MALEHWRYYLALEDDVLHTGRYVEIVEDNLPVYSIEYTRLLLALGSEIDVMCKQLCLQIDPTSAASNINQYHDLIAGRFPKIKDFPIRPVQWNFTWIPWNGWENGKPPSWWSDHNKVKHQRHDHYPKANLGNALEALCGLHVLNLFYYRVTGELGGIHIQPSKLTPHFSGGLKIGSVHPDNAFE